MERTRQADLCIRKRKDYKEPPLAQNHFVVIEHLAKAA